jgi:Peptidase family S41
MRYGYLFLICHLFWVGPGVLWGQVQSTKLNVNQLQSDFIFLRKCLEEAHPSLYWYTPKESLDQAFDETFAQLDHDMTEVDFGRLLKPLIAKIRCGHTDLRFSPSTRKSLMKPRKYWFPFQVVIQKDRLWVAQNNSQDSSLVAGTEIVEIEGVLASKVLRTLRRFLPADGYNETFKDAVLENPGFFDEYFWLAFGAKESYQCTFRHDDGRRQTLGVNFVGKPRKWPARGTREEERQRKLEAMRSLTFPDNMSETAWLDISAFAYDEMESFQTYHELIFKKLEPSGICRLVIDLRKNMGGNHEIAMDLMRYLVEKQFVLTARGEAPVFKPSFVEHFENQGLGMGFRTSFVKKADNGQFYFDVPSVGLQQPYDQYRFKGEIYVLTSPQTFSAASSFVASLRAQRFITVLGQETGGGEAGCNGGIISNLVLPQSQLRLQFPHFRILTAVKQPQIGRGVVPDVLVHYTAQDKIEKRDLERAILQKMFSKKP